MIMRRWIWCAALSGLAATAGRADTPLFVTPDVPTVETATGATLLPWQIFRYQTGPVSYTLVLTVPGNPAIDGIHKMDAPGDWLLSFEAPTTLGGALGAPAFPRDVVRYDGGSYSLFFCGSTPAIPEGVNVDAVALEGGDTGSLILSFDRPVVLGAFVFEPADLVRFLPTGG